MTIRRHFFPLVLLTFGFAAQAAPPAEDPVKIDVKVAPPDVRAGGDAAVTIELVPREGIKLNKYPKIKLSVPEAPGIAAAAEAAIGNPAPPPANELDANYYKGHVDPLSITLHVDQAAAPGRHDLPAKLSYFYCVAASGYCAPAKVAVSIPITVR